MAKPRWGWSTSFATPNASTVLTLVASQKESAHLSLAQLRQDLQEQVVSPAFAEQSLQPDDQTRIFINPEGPFVSGGPAIHAGLTGRKKNGIDTYGDYAKHGSAALSGKDPPLRIDRIGAYAARHAAKKTLWLRV